MRPLFILPLERSPCILGVTFDPHFKFNAKSLVARALPHINILCLHSIVIYVYTYPASAPIDLFIHSGHSKRGPCFVYLAFNCLLLSIVPSCHKCQHTVPSWMKKKRLRVPHRKIRPRVPHTLFSFRHVQGFRTIHLFVQDSVLGRVIHIFVQDSV